MGRFAYVVPTNYVRDGERLLLHGSIESRLMTTLASGAPLCLSVTLLERDCLLAHGYGTFGELSLRGGAGHGGENRARRR